MFSMQHLTTMIFSLCILLLFQTAVAENEGESIVCQKEYLLYFVDKDPIIEESKLLPNGNIMIAYSCQSSDLSDPETRRYLSVFDQKGNLLSNAYLQSHDINDAVYSRFIFENDSFVWEGFSSLEMAASDKIIFDLNGNIIAREKCSYHEDERFYCYDLKNFQVYVYPWVSNSEAKLIIKNKNEEVKSSGFIQYGGICYFEYDGKLFLVSSINASLDKKLDIYDWQCQKKMSIPAEKIGDGRIFFIAKGPNLQFVFEDRMEPGTYHILPFDIETMTFADSFFSFRVDSSSIITDTISFAPSCTLVLTKNRFWQSGDETYLECFFLKDEKMLTPYFTKDQHLYSFIGLDNNHQMVFLSKSGTQISLKVYSVNED